MSDFFDFDAMIRESHPGHERWTVTWHIGVVRLGRKKCSLAICAKTGNVAFAASDLLHPLIVHDVFADRISQTCEDGKCCLDISCPYNKADPKLMKKYGIRNRQDLENVHRTAERLKLKGELKTGELHSQIYYEKAPIVVKKAPKHA